ncbi:hypothetical protein ABIB94_008192 [Bradyrhizobium sp. JR7.2]
MFTEAVLGIGLLGHFSATWTVPILALLSGSSDMGSARFD